MVMKKILVILFAIVSSVVAQGADYEYLPLVEEGKTWHYTLPDHSKPCWLTMKGDTIIDGITYKKIFFGDNISPDLPWPVAYMHEENKIVTAKENFELTKWISSSSSPKRTEHSTTEFYHINDVKYDFNDYSAPDYTDQFFSAIRTYINMGKKEDTYYGCARTSVYWWSDTRANSIRNCCEVWLTEGIGVEGDNVHLLKPVAAPYWPRDKTVSFGYLSHVTNAQGEIIYKGHYFREEESAVQDRTNALTIISEEYFSPSGAKMSAPTGVCIKVTRYSDGSTKSTKELGY